MQRLMGALVLLLCLQSIPAALADPTPDQRRSVSDQMMNQLQQEGPIVAAPYQLRPAQIFASLLPYTQRRDITYTLQIQQNEKVNTVSTPDGRVVLYSGLVNRIQTDASALAFVEAHELAHLENKDGDKLMDLQIGTAVLGAVLAWRSDLNTKIGAAIAHQLLNSGYSRELDVKADARALELMQQAGFDPNGALVALKLAAAAEGNGMRVFPYKAKATDRYNNAMAWMNEHQVAVHPPSDSYINSLLVGSQPQPYSPTNDPYRGPR